MTDSKPDSTLYWALVDGGPILSDESPLADGRIPIEARKHGVRRFRPGVGNTKNTILYHEDEHDLRDVIERWLDENPQIEANNSAKAIHHGLCHEDSTYRKASSAVLRDRGHSLQSSDHVEQSDDPGKRPCPLGCGEQITGKLPNHLPDCPER